MLVSHCMCVFFLGVPFRLLIRNGAKARASFNQEQKQGIPFPRFVFRSPLCSCARDFLPRSGVPRCGLVHYLFLSLSLCCCWHFFLHSLVNLVSVNGFCLAFFLDALVSKSLLSWSVRYCIVVLLVLEVVNSTCCAVSLTSLFWLWLEGSPELYLVLVLPFNPLSSSPL